MSVIWLIQGALSRECHGSSRRSRGVPFPLRRGWEGERPRRATEGASPSDCMLVAGGRVSAQGTHHIGRSCSGAPRGCHRHAAAIANRMPKTLITIIEGDRFDYLTEGDHECGHCPRFSRARSQHIELYLDATYPLHEQRRLVFCSRCICNFIERSLAALRFRSPYSRLNIHCTRDPQSVRVRPLKKEPYLEVCIQFELPPLDSLPIEALQRKLAQIISSGLAAANKFTAVPVEECLQATRDFENGGFINRWQHLDKTWPQWNCRCVISAELTVDLFTTDQLVYESGSLIARRRIAATKPREGLFVEYLGVLSISDQGIMIYKKKGKVLSVFDLKRMTFTDLPQARVA